MTEAEQQELEKENKRLKAVLKYLFNHGMTSTIWMARKTGLSYKEINSWYDEENPVPPDYE